MHLLFLTGHHYAGKSTLAAWLSSQGFIEIALSTFLREMALEALHASGHTSITMETLTDGKDKPWPLSHEHPTPRDYLKELGALHREKNVKFLADLCEARVKDIFAEQPDASIVISDWRFPHEIEWAEVFAEKHEEVTLSKWRIERPKTDPSPETIKARGETEAYIDSLPVDIVLFNGDDRKTLFAKARTLCYKNGHFVLT